MQVVDLFAYHLDGLRVPLVVSVPQFGNHCCIGSVCLFFLTQIRKNRCDSYKKRRPCVLSNVWIVAISVGLPAAVNNPVPASQVGFQQCRAIERFCIESSNKCSDHGHSSNDLEVFTDRTFRASFLAFPKLIDAFHFFPPNNGRGDLTSRLAWGLTSFKSGPGDHGSGVPESIPAWVCVFLPSHNRSQKFVKTGCKVTFIFGSSWSLRGVLLSLNVVIGYGIYQWYPTFFGVGAEFQISEYVWSHMKTLK